MRRKTRDIKEKWITVKYDYVPKYCQTYKLYGHSANECFVIHPNFYLKEEDKDEIKEDRKKNKG